MEDEEIKIGAEISARNKEKIQNAHDALAELGAACKIPDATPKMLDLDETYVNFGGEVKAVQVEGGWKVRAPLVVFTTQNDPDLTGEDYFDASTDFDMEFPGKSTTYFNHGLDQHFKLRRLAPSSLTKDDFAVWAETILNEADEYEAFLIELGKAGKLGMSSGVPAHLVEREPVGKAMHITYWPLGKDASFTHTPAEPKTRNIIPLKSLIEITPTQAAVPATAESVDEPIQPIDPVIGDTKMATIEELEAKLADLEAKMEAAPATKKAPAYNKAPLGDDAFKAFGNWARTGDPSGLQSAVKLVDWQEGTDTEGGVVVPNEVLLTIKKKRDELSVVRASGASVLQTSSKKVTVPAESAREAAFVSTAEEATYDAGNTTPLAAVDITPVKYTRLTKVSEELLHDDKNDIVGFLMSRYARAIATMENTQYMTGTGDGDPAIQGIVAGGTAAKTFVAANPTAAEIVALNYLLPAAYEAGSCWYMRHATLGIIMGLAASYGFTFQPVGAAGNPFGNVPMLMGKPVYLTDGIAAAALSAKSVVIGNPEFYQIVDNGGMVVNRNPWLYMLNGQVGFFASVRTGGAVLQAEAFQYGTSATG